MGTEALLQLSILPLGLYRVEESLELADLCSLVQSTAPMAGK